MPNIFFYDEENMPPKVLLIVECQPNLNWYKIFEGVKLFGTEEVKNSISSELAGSGLFLLLAVTRPVRIRSQFSLFSLNSLVARFKLSRQNGQIVRL